MDSNLRVFVGWDEDITWFLCLVQAVFVLSIGTDWHIIDCNFSFIRNTFLSYQENVFKIDLVNILCVALQKRPSVTFES